MTSPLKYTGIVHRRVAEEVTRVMQYYDKAEGQPVGWKAVKVITAKETQCSIRHKRILIRRVSIKMSTRRAASLWVGTTTKRQWQRTNVFVEWKESRRGKRRMWKNNIILILWTNIIYYKDKQHARTQTIFRLSCGCPFGSTDPPKLRWQLHKRSQSPRSVTNRRAVRAEKRAVSHAARA